MAENAKCRFGVDSDFIIVDAEVLDYEKLMCRSPADFKLPQGGDQSISVPFGVSFNGEEFQPWTQDLNRFSFYVQPKIAYATPSEVEIGKMSEIYLTADDDSLFFEPTPTHKAGIKAQSAILCNFEEFGNSMGMYVNETTLLCVTPNTGDPEDYGTNTVKVSVAMNGQDFNQEDSEAEVTFVGTGSNTNILKILFWIILLSLLGVAIAYFGMALMNYL